MEISGKELKRKWSEIVECNKESGKGEKKKKKRRRIFGFYTRRKKKGANCNSRSVKGEKMDDVIEKGENVEKEIK